MLIWYLLDRLGLTEDRGGYISQDDALLMILQAGIDDGTTAGVPCYWMAGSVYETFASLERLIKRPHRLSKNHRSDD